MITASGTLVIGKGTATVTLAAATLKQSYDGVAKLVTATTVPSNLTVTFTYNGSSVAPNAVGSHPVVITVSDVNYQGTASGILVIGKGVQTITFGVAPSVVVGGSGTVSATGGASTSAVIFSSTTPTICTVSGSTVTGVLAGSCIIAANQAGDANYTVATSVTQALTIGTGVQKTTLASGANSKLTGTANLKQAGTLRKKGP